MQNNRLYNCIILEMKKIINNTILYFIKCLKKHENKHNLLLISFSDLFLLLIKIKFVSDFVVPMNLFCFVRTETAFNEYSVEMTNGQWMGGTVRSSGEGLALVGHTLRRMSRLFLDYINFLRQKAQ